MGMTMIPSAFSVTNVNRNAAHVTPHLRCQQPLKPISLFMDASTCSSRMYHSDQSYAIMKNMRGSGCTPPVSRNSRLPCNPRKHSQLRICMNSGNGKVPQGSVKSSSKFGHRKPPLVVALNNLCVDVIKELEVLPPTEKRARLEALSELIRSPPPPMDRWEVGGASNFAIAAARLGMDSSCLGHLGQDGYGDFNRAVLEREGVGMVQICNDDEDTLVCWVMRDPQHNHSFCSRFDFTSKPLLASLKTLPPHAEAVIREARALVVNGFVFDELEPSVVCQAVRAARDSGTAVFFDLGPRGKPLRNNVPEGGTEALSLLLSHSDVLLLTQEEAETVTGIADPIQSARSLLNAKGSKVEWVVLKVGAEGCYIATRETVLHHPAMKITVEDTVGCGDSMAAAMVLGYINGYEMMPTLALANAVGGATATRRGAGRNVATAELVEALLEQKNYR
mmetsp:Transcript_13385/g.25697  ORF Transcript_13385/g.25697 Transcript_13385/m.25697 type:complete len:449 (-) Transcript_13385:663-2009(-)